MPDPNPHLLIVSGPSGVGKTTLVSRFITHMQAKRPGRYRLCISHTTRRRKAGEVAGQHYFFVDNPTFARMIAANELVEWAEVFGNYYGTSRRQIDGALATGTHPVLEIDCQGARQVRQLFPHAVTVFIRPPSLQILQQRLQGRGRDNDEEMRLRMQAAQRELAQAGDFHHRITNDDLVSATARLVAIVEQGAHPRRDSV